MQPTVFPTDQPQIATPLVVRIVESLPERRVPAERLQDHLVRTESMGKYFPDPRFPGQEILREGIRDTDPVRALAEIDVLVPPDAGYFLQAQERGAKQADKEASVAEVPREQVPPLDLPDYCQVGDPQIIWDDAYGSKGGYLLYFPMLEPTKVTHMSLFGLHSDVNLSGWTRPGLLADWGYGIKDADINFCIDMDEQIVARVIQGTCETLQQCEFPVRHNQVCVFLYHSIG